ncbi:MAG: pentapeptide repeat-containing protein [gamma proteobacterium symbiont of Bathyaustriella thionipta]|nr:pentapeptide repeat-containing protein [gamma proteobacterium symbiont of Bathyaustriella thionipta]MCU7951763.1 pentapeptide repeat-containing protein [gamma proteobacterium symbiont of Bathyaustriella thionipta]MCU7958369.1 pentapeptide repeat-containing protein [gamma proteobacterium symbiont of Bathyaustriella thionipta]
MKHSRNQLDTRQCQYLSPEGERCQQHSQSNNLCFWHDNQTNKTDDEQLVNKLQKQAKAGVSLVGYSLKRAELAELNLVRHNSKAGYDLSYADLYHANLRGAHLFHIDLHGASLMKANFQNSNIHCANLEDCNLLGINLTNARIENVSWGKKLLQEKNADLACIEGDHELMLDSLEQAEEIYRNLRKTAENQGLFELSGYFFYKEMVMRRYQLPRFSFHRSISMVVDLFCGYGEKPLNVVLFSLFLIGICTITYFILGLVSNGVILQLDLSASLYSNFITFLECLYFSVVTFTTLGYGDIVPIGSSRPVAAFEAFTGNFTIALFVVVFVKK